MLVKDGFDVMVYCTDDVVFAKRLEEAGAAAIMPDRSSQGRHRPCQQAEGRCVVHRQRRENHRVSFGQRHVARHPDGVGIGGPVRREPADGHADPEHRAPARPRGHRQRMAEQLGQRDIGTDHDAFLHGGDGVAGRFGELFMTRFEIGEPGAGLAQAAAQASLAVPCRAP